LRLLGEIQSKRNDPNNAIKNLTEGITLLKEVGNPRQLWQAHESLGSIYESIGRSSEANEQWGAAKEIIQNTANGLSDHKLKEGFLSAEPIKRILSK
jgi:hypothetical protein